ncbi:SusC/RagA family TonB-linked outer membrane protein [Chitinophaga skermanii]|nr:SusC/RagA family TonB-linked outer membrane protein [Chitinophaga skermanii]
MKLMICLLLGVSLHISANSYAQQVSISVKDAKLERVLEQIKSQTGYTFVYKTEWLREAKNVDLQLSNAPLESALELAFKNQPFTYSITRKTIVIKQRDELGIGAPKPVETFQEITIRGRIVDEKGNALPGASIGIVGDKRGTVSLGDGTFSLSVPDEKSRIRVSMIGYQPVDYVATNVPAVIKLRLKDEDLNQVVVTGVMKRNKESFSGAAATYTGQQLRTISNTNVIQSLRTLDPSFLVLENNIAGANPNQLPTIELRGQTSISTETVRDRYSEDPNQPLFILNGFPATLRQIVDLDMNRVSSISILKDAASTALYGARAANGVVVVETIRPPEGTFNIRYNSDFNFEMPDISSYNRMNAAEKLEFERLSNVYKANSRFDSPDDYYQYYLPLYNSRLQDVLSGVDSYWLSDPLRNGVSQKHGIYVGGNSGAVSYELGGHYRKIEGVMKGDGRDEWSGTLQVGYRQNRLNLNNILYVNGSKENESPYGSFATWVNTNPYFKKAPADQRFLSVFKDKGSNGQIRDDSVYIANPLYNASIGNFDKGQSFNIQNNLQVSYNLTKSLIWESNLQLNATNTDNRTFKSPLHTSYFKQTEPTKRGELGIRTSNQFRYSANTMLSFYKNINKHSINASARAEVEEDKSSVNTTNYIGFPNASNGNLRFAYGYNTDKPASASMQVRRRAAYVGVLYYSYDNRYNFDVTWRNEGSTAYGAANPFQSYFGLGASWNLHNEKVIKDLDLFSALRVRGNIGSTGNQNFDSYTSITTYVYPSQYNMFGQGVVLSTKGNPHLKAQKTDSYNLGLDVSMMENRLNLEVNVYQKVTSPMVLAVELSPSSGLSRYPFNAGTSTVKGMEFNLRYNILQNRQKNLQWMVGVTGSRYNTIYSNLNTTLNNLNDKLREANSLVSYRDGYSPETIWAVRSLGIDPATGREIFQKLDGTQTFDYNTKDRVALGSTRPELTGVISTSVTYKGFYFYLAGRYNYNADYLNSSLYDRVENIDFYNIVENNQDKRALYERWKTAGDISKFKAISLTSTTPMSSRFIQKENSYTIESVSLAYTFNSRNFSWLNALRLKSLRISGIANEPLRISTIKRERGLTYPFSRKFSVSLNANF